MNVIVSNKNKRILDQLDVDVIKKIEGEYEVSELLSKLVNLYFDKLIIDITSIKNYKDIDVITSFAKSVDPSRVLLLLDDSPEVNANRYLSNLVNNGIYSFSRNIEGIKFLYGTPNSFENVKYLLETDIKQSTPATSGTTASSIAFGANYAGSNTSNENKVYANNSNQVSQSSNNFSTSDEYISELISGKKVIGLANMTLHAGASTLTNMMVRQLNKHDIHAKGIEMFRQDLIYYRSDDLISCMSRIDLERALRDNSDVPAIIIDLNEFPEAKKFCTDILYLVEPSFIKITKCIKKNKNAFVEKKDSLIVLNMSFVSEDEVYDFEIETGVKVYYNMPPINDRDEDSDEVNGLLRKLGFNI